jgi:hypothetical protein
MALSFDNLKTKLKASAKAGTKTASRALLQRGGLLTLGAAPVVRRNLKVEATWSALLSDPPINHSDPNNWRKGSDVRPSSFPFCPRRYAFDKLGLTAVDTFDVGSCFYTEVGKAVHYVAQNAIARTGRLWGYWKCARPTCGRVFSQDASFYPADKQCPKCQADLFEYEEMALEDEEIGLRGHTDGVIVYKDYSAILEVKTSDDEKVQKLKGMSDADITLLFQTEAPWYGYWHQAATYATMFRLLNPTMPPMREVQYLVFSRNSPKNVVAFSLPVPPDNQWWFEIRARIATAQRARDLKILPEGFAQNENDLNSLPSCRWCSYRDVCLKPENRLVYTADARYDTDAKKTLDQVLQKERTSMGGIIQGDVVESTDVFVPPNAPAPAPKKDEDENKKKEEQPTKD